MRSWLEISIRASAIGIGIGFGFGFGIGIGIGTVMEIEIGIYIYIYICISIDTGIDKTSACLALVFLYIERGYLRKSLVLPTIPLHRRLWLSPIMGLVFCIIYGIVY